MKRKILLTLLLAVSFQIACAQKNYNAYLVDSVFTLRYLDKSPTNYGFNVFAIPVKLKCRSFKFEKIEFSLDQGTIPYDLKIENPTLKVNPRDWEKDSTYQDTIIIISTNMKSPHADIYNNEYTGKITINNDTKDSILLKAVLGIARSKLEVFGALYYSLPKIFTEDNPNLTQTYIRFNLPLSKRDGIDDNSPFIKRLIWFRNLFIQFTYTTNSDGANFLTKNDTAFLNTIKEYIPNRSINRLDILENQNWNLSFTVPFLTYVVPKHKNYGDLMHIYFEPFLNFLNTTVTHPKDTLNINSLQYGISLALRTENTFLDENRFNFEVGIKIFWINSLSNSILPNLNFQFNHKSDYASLSDKKQLINNLNKAYVNFDALAIYNTNKNHPDTSSNLFVHFSLFTNLPAQKSSRVYNNFYLIQFGYALDIAGLISKIEK